MSPEGPFVPTRPCGHHPGAAEPRVLLLLPLLSEGNWGEEGGIRVPPPLYLSDIPETNPSRQRPLVN